ncbi:hypothetical protein [Chroococcidiopsis sp. TS-821]|uniref:hypothetical protein n=1 Tax=Chroococcidiopsis sp. TS-821 TaxID=1378066 RepID=UPI0030DBCEF5
MILQFFLRVDEFSEQFRAKHEFIKRLHRRYQQEEIEILYPVRTVYLPEKNQTVKRSHSASEIKN